MNQYRTLTQRLSILVMSITMFVTHDAIAKKSADPIIRTGDYQALKKELLGMPKAATSVAQFLLVTNDLATVGEGGKKGLGLPINIDLYKNDVNAAISHNTLSGKQTESVHGLAAGESALFALPTSSLAKNEDWAILPWRESESKDKAFFPLMTGALAAPSSRELIYLKDLTPKALVGTGHPLTFYDITLTTSGCNSNKPTNCTAQMVQQ